MLQLLQITLTCVTLLAATLAWLVWRRVFASLRVLKRLNDLDQTTADLQSSFESLMDSHKRLRSRTGMRELREERKETKAEILARVFPGHPK